MQAGGGGETPLWSENKQHQNLFSSHDMYWEIKLVRKLPFGYLSDEITFTVHKQILRSSNVCWQKFFLLENIYWIFAIAMTKLFIASWV